MCTTTCASYSRWMSSVWMSWHICFCHCNFSSNKREMILTTFFFTVNFTYSAPVHVCQSATAGRWTEIFFSYTSSEKIKRMLQRHNWHHKVLFWVATKHIDASITHKKSFLQHLSPTSIYIFRHFIFRLKHDFSLKRNMPLFTAFVLGDSITCYFPAIRNGGKFMKCNIYRLNQWCWKKNQ